MTSDNDLSISCLGKPRALRRCLKFARHSSNVIFEEFVLSLAFNEASFYPRRVALGEVGILKGFSRLIVGFDVQDGFLRESLSFENCCIKESYILPTLTLAHSLVNLSLLLVQRGKKG